MHAMYARLPKHFVLEERLERYADAIEVRPWAYRGRWAEACWPVGEPRDGGAFAQVRVDLGCGKGAFLVASAVREPDVLFVGMDAEPLCIAYAAQHIMEAELANAVVVPAQADVLPRVFGPGEVEVIHLNFPTPYPRKKDAKQRMFALERLLEYREVLAPGGTVRLRTDSQPLRDFFLTQLEAAGYEVVRQFEDERAGLWSLSAVDAVRVSALAPATEEDLRQDEGFSTFVALRRLEELHGLLGSWDKAILAFAEGPAAGVAADADALAGAPVLQALAEAEARFADRPADAFAAIPGRLARRDRERETLRAAEAAARTARVDSLRKKSAAAVAATTSTRVYKVKRGDTLGAIAIRYHVRVSDLKKWNNLRGDMIREGQKLVIHSKSR